MHSSWYLSFFFFLYLRSNLFVLSPVCVYFIYTGTDNGEADTSLNHAAYWSLSHTNHFTGNRAANSFNGLFFHPSFAPKGRAFSENHVCTNFLPLGRVVGNTCHGH